MPPAKKPAARRGARSKLPSPTAPISRQEVEAATKRFEQALEEAQSLLVQLRQDLGRNARTAYKDVADALRRLRTDARSTNRNVVKDVEKFASSLARAAGASSGAKAAKPAARKPAAAKRGTTTARARTASTRGAAAKSAAAKTTAAKSTRRRALRRRALRRRAPRPSAAPARPAPPPSAPRRPSGPAPPPRARAPRAARKRQHHSGAPPDQEQLGSRQPRVSPLRCDCALR